MTARTLVCALGLAVLVAAVYAPAAHFEFINFDDPLYVTAEPRVRDGLGVDSVRWAFTGPHAKLWHPLTTLSHLLDVERCGLDAGCHHVTSVALHAANAALVVLVFAELTGRLWASLALATLFALHPLRVESVAWISERKDVLSAFFALLALLAYGRFVRAPTRGGRLAVFTLATAAMLAKPMLVTLPVVFLLLDVWPLGRRRDATLITEKLPLVAVAAAVSVATYLVQRAGGAVVTLDAIPVPARLANATVSYVRYLAMTLAPHDLAVFYPYAPVDSVRVFGAGAALVAVTAAAWWARDRIPAVAIGWAWYLVTLLPVIGLVQAGSQSHADRFTYFPSLGLGLAVVWSLERVMQRTRHAAVMMVTVVVVFAVLGIAGTRRYLPMWEDSGKLFRNALAVTTENYLAHMNLGQFIGDRGEDEEADAHYREALRIRPQYVPALVNVGNRLAREGRLEDAAEHYRQAIARDPSVVQAHNGLGFVLDRSGRTDAALAEFDRALALDPRFLDARLNRAHALRVLQRPTEATEEYQRVLATDPDQADAYYGMALTKIGMGDQRGAAAALQEAMRVRPAWPDALEVAAWLLASANDADVRNSSEAIRLAMRARELRGRDTTRALIAVATAHLVDGRRVEARDAAVRARTVAEAEGDLAARDEAERLLRVAGAADAPPEIP